MPQNEQNRAIARQTLIEATELFEAKQDTAALSLYRQAVSLLLATLQQDVQGETLVMLLRAFRGLAVSAFVTGHTEEGCLALGTAIVHAEVGLKTWPSAPPLLEEMGALSKMEAEIGGKNPVYIQDHDIPWSWPFDD